MDKLTQALVSGLKQALTQPGEQRLFRSGKLPGIFASRAGFPAEAASQALRDGLLEIARTETKGKVTTEWVRATSRAVEFVHHHESPVEALRDLQAVLQTTQQGIPSWVAELRQSLQALGDELTQNASKIALQIDGLSERVAQAIARAETGGPRSPVDATSIVSWGGKAVAYLDKRKSTGTAEQCTLPELFTALRDQQPALTLAEYHAGLRKLHDRGALLLLAYQGSNGLPEPEYALLDGATTLYYVGLAS
jgi:hypothetical protein